jgi:hypothetical protein
VIVLAQRVLHGKFFSGNHLRRSVIHPIAEH